VAYAVLWYLYGYLYGPIEDIVVLKTLTNEEITEDLSEVDVIRLVIEAEGMSVVEVNGKLVGQAMAKDFGTGGHFLKHDAVILMLGGSSLETLPWKGATAEVQHNISKGLHIITSRLLCENFSIEITFDCTRNIPTPRWALMEAYRAVPGEFLFSL
jgi:hypothetical protein